MQDNISNNKTIILKWISVIVLIIIIITCVYIWIRSLFYSNNNISNDAGNNTTDVPVNNPRYSSILREQRIKIPEVQISQAQLSENNTLKSCWTLVDGVVYDVTYFLRRSQRGKRAVKLSIDEQDVCGKDSSKIFNSNNNPITVDEDGPISIYSNPVGRISNR